MTEVIQIYCWYPLYYYTLRTGMPTTQTSSYHHGQYFISITFSPTKTTEKLDRNTAARIIVQAIAIYWSTIMMMMMANGVLYTYTHSKLYECDRKKPHWKNKNPSYTVENKKIQYQQFELENVLLFSR